MKQLIFLIILVCAGCGSSNSNSNPNNSYHGTDLISTWEGVLNNTAYDSHSGFEIVKVTSQYTYYEYYDGGYNRRVVHDILVRNVTTVSISVTVTVIQGASYRTITLTDVQPGEYRTVPVHWDFQSSLWLTQEVVYSVIVPISNG